MNSLLKALKLKKDILATYLSETCYECPFSVFGNSGGVHIAEINAILFHLLNNLLILNKKLRKLKNKDYICSIKVFNSLGRDTELKGNAV